MESCKKVPSGHCWFWFTWITYHHKFIEWVSVAKSSAKALSQSLAVYIDKTFLHKLLFKCPYWQSAGLYMSSICIKLSIYLFWINAHHNFYYKDVALILPHMDYALPVWGTFYPTSVTSSKLGYLVTSQVWSCVTALPCSWLVTCYLPSKILFTLCYAINIVILDSPTVYCLDHNIHTELAVHLTLLTYQGVHYLLHSYSTLIWWYNLPQYLLSGPMQDFSLLLHDHPLNGSL